MMASTDRTFNPFKIYWKLIVVIVAPIFFALIFAFSTSKEARCGYVIIIMAVYWMTEALPLAVTALMPVFAFPLLGILTSKAVCLVYMKETNMMFIGGLMVAISVEHSNLHKRIALFVILHVGQSPRRLMAGFMITTMFLSMWISNTASTAMMVPIVDAILQELYKTSTLDGNLEMKGMENKTMNHSEHSIDHNGATTENSKANINALGGKINQALDISDEIVEEPPQEMKKKTLTAEPPNEECRAMKDMYFLATAYAANIGGTGSITGTGPNLVVKGVLDSSFSDQKDLNFASWMAFNVPGMIICTIVGWIWLQFLFIGFGSRSRLAPSTPERNKMVRTLLLKEYRQLGRITSHEVVVLSVFISLVALWFFREPGFILGWSDIFKYLFGEKFTVGDAPPAIFAALLLFVIPSTLHFWSASKTSGEASPNCLNWETINDKMPWGIIILLGGGFAMAEASQVSELSIFLGKQLQGLDALPVSLSVFIMSLMTAMATEVASNTATASIIMPILRELALGICVNPLYLMIPAAVCCSYAFMLPVATPPNAIVFGASGMRTKDMMKAGLVMNVLCVIVINIMINTLGVAMFSVGELPSWAKDSDADFINNCFPNTTIHDNQTNAIFA